MMVDIVPLEKGYRGMARSLDVTHFKTSKSKSSFDAFLAVYLDYIACCCELDLPFNKLLVFYEKFRDLGVCCEVIVYDTCPIEGFYGYTVELLGIDIVHDMCESLIAEVIDPQIKHLLNKNGLCQAIEDVNKIIPFQDHGTADWQPCYVYSVILPS